MNGGKEVMWPNLVKHITTRYTLHLMEFILTFIELALGMKYCQLM